MYQWSVAKKLNWFNYWNEIVVNCYYHKTGDLRLEGSNLCNCCYGGGLDNGPVATCKTGKKKQKGLHELCFAWQLGN